MAKGFTPHSQQSWHILVLTFKLLKIPGPCESLTSPALAIRELPERKTVTLDSEVLEGGAKLLIQSFLALKRFAVGSGTRKSSSLIFSPCHELTDIPGLFADI
jgi:hypothetical protein